MIDGPSGICAKCGSTDRVFWCWAWSASYCEWCREARAETELREPVTVLPVRPA